MPTIPRIRFRRHSCLWGVAALLLASIGLVAAVEFWITDMSVGGDGKFHLQHTASATNYYILYRGETVTNINLPTVMALGQDGLGQLTDPALAMTNFAAFYRVRALPLSQPLDSDGDGFDDVNELQRGTNPLNPDSDGDGWDDGVEVADGTNPLDPSSQPRMTFASSPPVAVTVPETLAAAAGLVLANPLIEVTLPALEEQTQPQPTWVLASPPVEIVVPSLGEVNPSANGLTMANPPVEVVLSALEETQPPSALWIVTRPPVEVIVPPMDEMNPSTNGLWLARPLVEVSVPPEEEAVPVSFQWTLARPPVEVILPWAGESSANKPTTFLARPPVTLRWTTNGLTAAPP